MIRRLKWITFLWIIGCWLVLQPTTVEAQETTLMIQPNKESVQVGDYVEVIVSFTSAEDMGSIQASLRFDGDTLKYVSGNSNALKVEKDSVTLNDFFNAGVDRLVYTMEFLAVAVGTGSVEVTSSEIISAGSGIVLGTPAGRASIRIVEKQATPLPVETPEEPGEGMDGLSLQDRQGRKILLMKEFPDHMVPVGFEKTTLSIFEVALEGALSSDQPWTLLYGIDENLVEGLYGYRKDQNTVFLYMPIHTNLDVWSLQTTKVPVGYNETSLELNGQTLLAYAMPNEEEFYLIYGMGPTGDEGFYRYDVQEKTLQRMKALPSTQTQNPQKRLKTEPIVFVIMGGLSVLCTVMLGMFLYIHNKNKR